MPKDPKENDEKVHFERLENLILIHIDRNQGKI